MRPSYGWPITLAVVMISLVVALIVGWIILTVRDAEAWYASAAATIFARMLEFEKQRADGEALRLQEGVAGFGLFRTGAVPAWVAALLVLGAITFPVGHIGSIQFVQHLAETILLVPMIWIGLRYLASATPRGVAVPATA